MYHYMDNAVHDHAFGGRHLTQSDNYVWLVPQPPSSPAAAAPAPQASPPIPPPVPSPILAPSSSTSDNTALYVGLGVGIGGALLIGLALGLLIRWHLRRRRTSQQPDDTSKAQARDSYPNYYHGSQDSSKRSDFDEEKEDDLEMARYFTPRENPISGPGPYHIFNGPIPYPVPLNVDPGRDKLLHTAWNWPTFGNHVHAPFVMHPGGLQTPSPPYVVAGGSSFPMQNGGPSNSWAMQHHSFEGAPAGMRPFDTVDQGSIPYHPGPGVVAHHAVIVGQQHGQAVWVAANMLPLTQAATASQNAKPSYVMEEIVDSPPEEEDKDDNQATEVPVETNAATQLPVDPPQSEEETHMDGDIHSIRPEMEANHEQMSQAVDPCASSLPTQHKSKQAKEEENEDGEHRGDGMPPFAVNKLGFDQTKRTLVDRRHALWARHADEIDSLPLDSVASEEESAEIALPTRRILLQSDRPPANNTGLDTCEIETVGDSMDDDSSGGWSPPTPQRPDLDVSRVLSPPDHSTEKKTWRGPLGYDPSGLLTPYASEGPNSAREGAQEGIPPPPGVFMPRKRALLDTLQTVDIGVGRTFADLNSQNLEDTLVDQEEWDRFCQFELRDIFTRDHHTSLTDRHNEDGVE